MRTVRCSVPLTLIVGLVAVSARAESIDELQKLIGEKLAKVRTLTADQKMTGSRESPVPMTFTTTGTVVAAQRDGKYYVRQNSSTEQVAKLGDKEQVFTTRLKVLMDGEFMYQIQNMNGNEVAMKSIIDNPPPLGDRYFQDLRQRFDLSAGDDASVNGEACWIIYAKDKKEVMLPPPQPEKLSMAFRKSDGLLVEMKGLLPDGRALMSLEFTNYKTNVDVNWEDFKFEPGPNTTIRDRTLGGAARAATSAPASAPAKSSP